MRDLRTPPVAEGGSKAASATQGPVNRTARSAAVAGALVFMGLCFLFMGVFAGSITQKLYGGDREASRIAVITGVVFLLLSGVVAVAEGRTAPRETTSNIAEHDHIRSLG